MRRRRRGSDDETNWGVRDDLNYYGDQVKAVPEVAKGLFSIPKDILGAVKEMADDMKRNPQPPPPREPDPPA